MAFSVHSHDVVAFHATRSLETQQVALVDNYLRSDSGFILADVSLKPLYANTAAFRILNYSNEPLESVQWDSALQAQLLALFQFTSFTVDSLPTPFVSGRRHYVCRSFVLDVPRGDMRQPLVALLMERAEQPQSRLLEASRRFHLSPRECETVVHLTRGLTTKEIAERMNVSPNTVKQFVRLIMTKMGVTTRSGVVGKLLSA